jgi:formate dehydrogenase maturation protein FdhE
MEKYCFEEDVWETPTKCKGKKKVIRYKCLICGYTHDYDDTWTDEKKAEVKAEVDAHHNEHFNISS